MDVVVGLTEQAVGLGPPHTQVLGNNGDVFRSNLDLPQLLQPCLLRRLGLLPLLLHLEERLHTHTHTHAHT